MNLSVSGLGMVSKIGKTEDLMGLLAGNRVIDWGSIPSGGTVSLDIPDEFNISHQFIRRMNHFAKISLVSACRAVRDSGLELWGKTVGIIQGSVYGPIISGIQAFDDLIDFGDNQLSPLNFSGSVFNTAATYLSLAFGIQGPTVTHTSGLDTLFNSIQTAGLWLETNAMDYVIVGIGDEYSPFFDNHCVADQQPAALLPTGEGWITFILSKADDPKYGTIEYSRLNHWPDTRDQKNIYSLWHEQMVTGDWINRTVDNPSCFPVHWRGSYPSAAAFDLALALVCKKTERFPVYHAMDGNYLIQTLMPNDRIYCYGPSENNGIYCFATV